MGKARHTKKSWRSVNIQDVDNFLEDQRLQERLGTNFATKPDHELFVIDTKPSKNQLSKSKNRSQPLTRSQKKRLLLTETPNCFKGLVNTSKVPEPCGERNHVKPVTLSKQTIEKKLRRDIRNKKHDVSKKDRQRALDEKDNLRYCRSEFKKDLWSEEVVDKKHVACNEWFSDNTAITNTLSIRPKMPTRKRAKFLPVNLPHPGTSYNPTFKEHQDLLQSVVEDEIKVIKEEKHLNRVTSDMFRKVTVDEFNDEFLSALQEGLETNNENDNEQDDGEYKPINPPVVNKKKDLKKRRNMREQNLILSKTKLRAVEKKKIADIYKLRFIKDDIETTEKMNSVKKMTRNVKKATEIKTPQISGKPFKEPPSVFSTADELSGNLRNIKPQGGGLAEQFTSLQRRGLASVSTLNTLKKKPKKRYTLGSHRMPWDTIERPVRSKKNP